MTEQDQSKPRAPFAVDADFEGGAIHVLAHERHDAVELALRPDSAAEFMQWFHFRVRGAEGKPCVMRITNAGEATYPDAYEGYRACASYDGGTWFRVPTTYEGGVMTIEHTPEAESALYAYFAPYAPDRHRSLEARVEASPRARIEVLGESVQGRPMRVIVVGGEPQEGEAPRLCIWVIARQHPGETMGGWFVEGMVERLLREDDALANEMLGRAVFYLVPDMNPDGGALGNLRTNAAGANLNREWLEPSPESSPEVYAVRDKMFATGVDLFLDIHGDERNPYIFAAGCEGNPGYGDRLDALEDLFMNSLMELNEDFQREYGYERDQPGEADLSTASNWVGERFDCLSLTLEMPFKDDANHPDPSRGWSPERSRALGESCLETMYVCFDSLR